MADMHYFDINVAEQYGVNCAILLQNIWHWVRKNEANGKHFHDGSYWTYNSTKAFSVLFPYLTNKQIRTALAKLVEEGILQVGNYNEMKYDRTTWYSVTEKGRSMLLEGQMDLPSGANGNSPQGEPIPDINTHTKPNNKPNSKRVKKPFVPPTLEEVDAYCKERKNNVDPKKFFDYFNASDWVDSNGKDVRNWKQKVITWENYAKPKESNTNGQATGDSGKVRISNII